MSDYAHGHRVNKKQNTTALIPLILVLLLTTMMMATAITSTHQTTQSIPQQNTNYSNPTTEGGPPTGTYWAKTYGGGGNDVAYSVEQTSEGGYVVAGYTNPSGTQYFDVLVLKLDSAGSVTWQKTYGWLGDDVAYSVQQTSDGGYIVAGYTTSSGMGFWDVWLLKLDSAGTVTWQKTYGGASYEGAFSVQQTSDGGYVVAGTTTSFGAGSEDIWVLKLDPAGTVTWEKTYGGTGSDYSYLVQQTSDGGYIVAGETYSFGAVGCDVWVLKLDSAGSVTWQKAFGGTGDDYAMSVQQTVDGGYIVAGYTTSFGAGYQDIWVLKLDPAGSVTWQKTYGSSVDDYAYSVQQTGDGGYIVAGYAWYNFGTGSYDFWVLKLDSTGGVTWQKFYGGSGYDYAYSVQQTGDGGYIVAGYTWLSFGAGGYDFWVLKLRVGGDIVWDAGSGASTHPSSVTPSDSSGTASMTSASSGNSAAAVQDTLFTPQDTNLTITIQSSPPTTDTTPPATITDLAAGAVTSTSITLTWTAPGDDGMRDNATGYILKYSASGPITSSNWASATTYTQTWTPAKNGTAEIHDILGLVPNIKYWFAIKAYDDVPNYNGVSNSPTGTTISPPSTYWAKTYGGGATEIAYSIQQTADGGYIVAGNTNSYGAGGYDVWLLKLGSTGSVTWEKTYGGSSNDYFGFVQQTSDGGYVVAGGTNSTGAGGCDVWVLKLNSTGSVTWQKTYGGPSEDEAFSVQQTSDGGYIVAGYTASFGAGVSDFWVLKLDSEGSATWQKTYGGGGSDWAVSVQQTSEGGYMVAGYTNSFGAGQYDFWVLKLDSMGSVSWQKVFGGSGDDLLESVEQTSDGGYILAGYTVSFGAGSSDVWVLKLDSTGGVSWQKTYGGGGYDYAYSVEQTMDGGYIVAGSTASYGAGVHDFWVLKLDSTGGVTWQKTYGGVGEEWAYSVQQTVDGGYMVTGYTASFGAGGNDVWVVKLGVDGFIIWDAGSGASTHTTSVAPASNPAGVSATSVSPTSSTAATANTTVTPQNTKATARVQATTSATIPYWAKTYGGSDTDGAYSFRQTADGGYIVAGWTRSFGAGVYDVWVLKLDSTGGVTWQKTYGWVSDDFARSIQQTSDGGYILAGATIFNGARDVWVLKLNSSGSITWQMRYGGEGADGTYSVQQTGDGGYIVAAYTDSFGAGGNDVWLLKLNSVGSVTWQKTYGGSGDDRAFSVQQTADGGYIAAGYTTSFGAGYYDAWILKLDSAGSVTWQKTYGATDFDDAYSVQQTGDGGYIVAGETYSFGAGDYDVWVLKLDSTGGVTWQKTYGGTRDDEVFSVQQTADGGYIVAAYTDSFGAGWYDVWVLKLDSTGSVTWQKTYGGSSNNDYASAVQQTADGGYIAAGYAASFGAGGNDVWVVKLGVGGDIVFGASSGASTHTTSVTPSDSSATASTTSVTPANSAASIGFPPYSWHETYATVTVQSPPPAPIIDQPSDITYAVGQIGNSITWNPISQIPSMYYVTRNGTIVASGIWSGTPITQSVDGLDLGRYIYTCTVNDTLGRGTSSNVQVLVLPPAPTIDQPSSITYTVDQTGNSITWHPTSEIPDHYTISVDGSPPTSYDWDGSAITYNVDGLQVGTYIYNCTVYDTSSRKASSIVQVTVLPLPPTIDQPSAVTYTYGETGNSITWNPISQIPDHYTISVDGDSPVPYSWDGQPITYNVDGLPVGTHTYNCTVYDAAGRKASSIVEVTVLPPAPTIDQPATVTYTFGQTGNTITWHPTSEIPEHYTISVDGSSPTYYSWNGEAITSSVDGLSVGTHSYNCTVYDTEGRTASSEVQVTVLPPTPTIDQPSAITYIIGQTGNSITWNPSSQIPNYYTITVNDGYPLAYSWDGSSITQSVDGLLVGTYTFNCTVYDKLGRSASSKVTVTVLPPAPTIDQPSAVTYAVGHTGNDITWNPSSQIPSKYSITRNGTIVASGTWTGTPITQGVGGLSVGKYIYACTVNDTLGRTASSSVQVLVVLPPAPTIDQPSAITYVAGITGNTISWHSSSEIPDHYTISVDGSSPTSHSWNGSAITYNADGLSQGAHSVNCTVYDTYGRSASSTVTVTVSAPSEEGIPPIIIAGGVAIAAIVLVILIVIITKRKK